MKLVAESDLIYMAGFFDGEGCLSISRKMSPRSFNPTYGVACTVTNTDAEILHWFQKTTGLGAVKPKPRDNKKWKLCHHWVLTTEEIAPFILALRPYLRTKKSRAELMLEFLETCKYHGHTSLSDPELLLREVIFSEMEELNRRGAT